MLLITLGPLLFMLLAFAIAGYGPSAGETPLLLLRIVAVGVTTALVFASASLAVSSLTTEGGRRGRPGAPLHRPGNGRQDCDRERRRTERARPVQLRVRRLEPGVPHLRGDPEDAEPVAELSAWLVTGGVAATIVAGFLVCWLRYRRLEGFRDGRAARRRQSVSKWFGALVAVSPASTSVRA